MNQLYQNQRTIRPRRSVLYVPANNTRAMEKSLQLKSDVVVYDLEDAVLPKDKAAARENLREFFKAKDEFSKTRKEFLIRINPLSSEFGAEDLLAARSIMPDGIVLPKVSDIDDLVEVNEALLEMDTEPDLRVWAMIETARGILNAPSIARYARTPGTRLDCLMAGINDLVKETKVHPEKGRPYLSNWLSQIVLAARAYDLDVIDGVFNDFRDLNGFDLDCQSGKAMGFDGKSVIHPSQIELANETFGIDQTELEEALSIVQAFEQEENHNAGVIQLDGKMVERLHLEMAQKLVQKATIIENLES